MCRRILDRAPSRRPVFVARHRVFGYNVAGGVFRMAYQSLYRKYRPQTFSDVIGQAHITRTLQNALVSGRIAHGYLFTGTRGTAKTTVARLLAKALNCEATGQPVAEPCNACDACRSITAGTCIDVIEMDAASHRGVADIEEVRKAVGYGPMQFRYKVFIIDEAHQLSSDAKDAFLKTLEEPPAHVVFVLATTEPQSIPITIRSRCQQFDFKRGSLAELSGRLEFVLNAEGVAFTPAAVLKIARAAEGSYRDALSLLEQVLAYAPERIDVGDVEMVLGAMDADSVARIVDAVARRDAPTAFRLAGEILDAGKEARTLLKTLAAHLRDLLLVRVGGPAVAAEMTPDEARGLQVQAQPFSPAQLLRAIDTVNEAQSETRWNNQHRLLVELTFLKLMTLGEGPDRPLATAEIVFSPPAEKVPRAEKVPLASPPPSPLSPPAPAEPSETLEADYFADDAPDEQEEDEDRFAPETLAAPVDETPPPPDEEEAAVDEGPSLFEEPAPPPSPPAGTPRPAPPGPETESDPHLTLARVQQAWPRFLTEAEKFSKQASVMLAAALPTEVAGRTIVITFTVRANYEMMSLPKKQEFVRKLLARCLEIEDETVPVRFVLQETQGQLSLARSAAREKVRHDPMALLDRQRAESAPPPDPPAPRPSSPPTPSLRPAPEPPPRRSAPEEDRPERALQEPLVQEALSVFGGEIVTE